MSAPTRETLELLAQALAGLDLGAGQARAQAWVASELRDRKTGTRYPLGRAQLALLGKLAEVGQWPGPDWPLGEHAEELRVLKTLARRGLVCVGESLPGVWHYRCTPAATALPGMESA